MLYLPSDISKVLLSSLTCATPPTFIACIATCVEHVIRVSLRAMGLGGIYSSNRLSSQGIDSRANQLKVCGLDTGTHSTQMVKNQPFWNWANQLLIGIAMWAYHPLMDIVAEMPIPLSIKVSRPEPTGNRFINMLPETFLSGLSQSITPRHNKTLRSIWKPKVLAKGLRLAPEGLGAL